MYKRSLLRLAFLACLALAPTAPAGEKSYELRADGAVVKLKLEDLRDGASKTFRQDGHTIVATRKGDDLRFTVDGRAIPLVSSIEGLAAGPDGLVGLPGEPGVECREIEVGADGLAAVDLPPGAERRVVRKEVIDDNGVRKVIVHTDPPGGEVDLVGLEDDLLKGDAIVLKEGSGAIDEEVLRTGDGKGVTLIVRNEGELPGDDANHKVVIKKGGQVPGDDGADHKVVVIKKDGQLPGDDGTEVRKVVVIKNDGDLPGDGEAQVRKVVVIRKDGDLPGDGGTKKIVKCVRVKKVAEPAPGK